ncbi:MAG: pyruvate kinase [Rhizobacter sp.]|nr:pyruvate kinase [Chlorobiales bacterium]
MKRTKIICTLGPATSTLERITALIEAGMNVARLNFSHGTHEDHKARIELIRQASLNTGKQIAIMQDLQGPKIRVGELRDKTVLLKPGEHLRITPNPILGTAEIVSTTYAQIVQDVQPNDRILIDDGLLELRVLSKTIDEVLTEVVIGGILKEKKGFNLPGVKVSIPSLTDKDIIDLEFGLANDVDMVALSFVREGKDVSELMNIIKAHRKETWIVAKIEKPEAITHIDDIIELSDAIMVARGDLGIEMQTCDVPILQKTIVQKCNDRFKPVIIATQMLESMIENPRPTRAEASDVANAVFDGTDAVMLSAETASGKYPVETVLTMRSIIESVESEANSAMLHRERIAHRRRSELRHAHLGEAVAVSAVQVAQAVGAKAIVTLTHSGSTAVKISKQKPECKIIAITDKEIVQRLTNLVWGVETILTETLTSTDESFQAIEQILVQSGLMAKGDTVVYTLGTPVLKRGSTDTIKISRVGE